MNSLRPATASAFLLLTAVLASLWQGHCPANADAAWTTLIDGNTMRPGDLGQWDQVGKANWTVTDGAVVANAREGDEFGYLVSKTSYRDFQIHAEFWSSDDANSGIFLRCADPRKPGSVTCYEVNIFDQRPKPEYGTGAIVDVAKVDPMPKAGGKWSTYDITAKGTHLVAVLNGVTTAEGNDSRHAEGPFALQYAGGTIKFRKVQIRPL
jgi:Domain of Unknown Function (DUF1080)